MALAAAQGMKPVTTWPLAADWTILKPMLQFENNLVAMAEALVRSGEYRVLRRLVPREISDRPVDHICRTGIILDVETTGLDQQKDEIIELGMVKFHYLPDGRIAGLKDVFTAFNEPSRPIPADVTTLTGITTEMVAGQRIDDAAVSAFVEDAVIVIAHNAGFDRKFAERYWPVFERKAWGCSATEVAWRQHGFEGSRLAYLLNGAGFFHQAHRAVDDCHALLEILALELPTIGAPALGALTGRPHFSEIMGLSRNVAQERTGRPSTKTLILLAFLIRPATRCVPVLCPAQAGQLSSQ